MRNQIEDQIDSAKVDLQKMEIDKARLEARIQTLEEMLELLPDDKPKRKPYRERQLSDLWQNILYIMAHDYESGASYDAIIEIARSLGEEIQKSNLRGHMGNYKQSGYITSLRDGIFIVTDSGKRKSSKPEETSFRRTGSDVSNSDNLASPSLVRVGLPSATTEIPDADPFLSVETTPFDSNLDDEIPF